MARSEEAGSVFGAEAGKKMRSGDTRDLSF